MHHIPASSHTDIIVMCLLSDTQSTTRRGSGWLDRRKQQLRSSSSSSKGSRQVEAAAPRLLQVQRHLLRLQQLPTMLLLWDWTLLQLALLPPTPQVGSSQVTAHGKDAATMASCSLQV